MTGIFHNIRKKRPFFFYWVFFLFIALIIPINAFAFEESIVPCGKSTGTVAEMQPCQLCHFFLGIHNLTEFGMHVVTWVALVFVVSGGILYMAAGSGIGSVEMAKHIMIGALKGFTYVLGAWLLVNTILWVLAGGMKGYDANSFLARIGVQGKWNEFSCSLQGVMTTNHLSSPKSAPTQTTTMTSTSIPEPTLVPEPQNNAPARPVINGPTKGIVGAEYTFVLSSSDPDGDKIKYDIDWNGDGTVDETTSLVNQGEGHTIIKSSSVAGNFTFHFRAVDERGAVSERVSYSIDIQDNAASVPDIFGNVDLFGKIHQVTGLGDTSVFVRSNNEVLLTGTNQYKTPLQSSLWVYRMTSAGHIDAIVQLDMDKLGYCQADAAEVAILNGKEILLFQALPKSAVPGANLQMSCAEISENTDNFRDYWYDNLSLYYMDFFDGMGKNQQNVRVQSFKDFFGGGDSLPFKIDGSLFCEDRWCYLSYVFFVHGDGNHIAIKKFSEDGKQNFPAREVMGLEHRQSITEAPVIRKIHGKYYLVYSTGSVESQYGMNYRFADSVDSLFNSSNNGVILSPFYENGKLVGNQGHGDVFELNGEWYLAFSSTLSKMKVLRYDQSGVPYLYSDTVPRSSFFKKLKFTENGHIVPFENPKLP